MQISAHCRCLLLFYACGGGKSRGGFAIWCIGGMATAERCVLTRRSAAVAKGLYVALRSSVSLRFRGASLRRCWLRQQPRGSLRRPRRDRGIAISPYSLLGFSAHPFVPPPLRWGVGCGGARRSCAALCRCCKGCGWCSAFCRCRATFARRAKAARGGTGSRARRWCC